MANTYLKLDTRRAMADGKYPIRISVGYGTHVYLVTGLSCSKDEWDAKLEKYTGKNSKIVNDSLAALLTRVKSRILQFRQEGTFESLCTNKNKLRAALMSDDVNPYNDDCLGKVFEEVIKTKAHRTAELYALTLKKLVEWRDDIYETKFEDINNNWLNAFNTVGLAGLSVNTKAIHMRNLRGVVNYAIDEEITQNYPFRRFHIVTEDTPMRVLPVEKMRFLRDLEIKSEYTREYRDIFLLIFYLMGINMVDLSGLTHNSVIDGRVEYRRAKTGKFYSIKLEPEAIEIIKRYEGKEHLLSCFDRYSYYKDFSKRLIEALQKIGETKKVGRKKVFVPLEPNITPYWARYSWATYAADLDIPKDTISECLGHNYGSRITGVYIKFSRDKIDAANRKVIDWFNSK